MLEISFPNDVDSVLDIAHKKVSEDKSKKEKERIVNAFDQIFLGIQRLQELNVTSGEILKTIKLYFKG